METSLPSFENFAKLKTVCMSLIQNPKNVGCIRELKVIVTNSPDTFIKVVQPTILSTFYPILKSISEDKLSFSEKEKQLIVDTLKNIFSKSTIEKLGLFLNMYAFLLFEIYDHLQHKVLEISEEYKLSIIECTTSLAKSISTELILELYTKENAPKLCQMLYVAIEVAKTEKMKSLRIAAIECIMSLAKVLQDDDFHDTVVCNQVAEVFLFFLPGIATGLKQIALEDEKVGHKIPLVALKAWGRIITLLMQDYNSSGNKLSMETKFSVKISKNINPLNPSKVGKKQKWKDNAAIREYLQSTKRTPEWYKDTDKKLQKIVVEFAKLTHHSHHKVRLELSVMCELTLTNCLTTMPITASHLIEIIIALTEDENEEISLHSNEALKSLSSRLSSDNFKSLLENLEEGFFNAISRLPRKFNSIDEREQLASLNLIIGYINVFREHKLNQVLLTGNHLNKLLQTLIHIAELENSSTGLLEEYSIKDLNLSPHLKPLWKNFRYFKEDNIRLKLEKLCNLLAKFGGLKIVSDFLLDVILYDAEHRNEAIFLLNELVAGSDYCIETSEIIKDILSTYIDSTYWNIPVTVSVNESEVEHTLAEVQHNAVQICLLVEGVGTIALVMKEHFKEFLFKTLYLVLEKAGNNHSFVRAAGLLALKNITSSCGYSDVTNLVNENIDYFAYHVEKKLNKPGDKENVLNVLTVVLKYSTMDVLLYIADIIKEVLVQSCDRFQTNYATAFLRVFKIFIQCLWRWLNIEIKIDLIKSKAHKLKDMEDFRVSGVKSDEDNNFSDDIMGKTAEDLFKEDMKKSQEELDKEIDNPEVEEYKKPDPPLHVKLTVCILARSLHFLPSKDKIRKLLVLEILSGGLEIIRDWEDELLPIVHQIWSPLVQRFKEFDDPVIINYSFQLLVTMARLSKEFIRMRTTKEVLPNILEVLEKLSKKSYLQDKGSAYRYSQNYKLQVTILENFGKILVDLDVQDEVLSKTMDCVFKYASDKQPLALQTATLEFFKIIAMYDPDPLKVKLDIWVKEHDNDEFSKNINRLCSTLEEIVII